MTYMLPQQFPSPRKRGEGEGEGSYLKLITGQSFFFA